MSINPPNPHKSINKVTINGFMMGSLFFVLTLIITLDPYKFSPFVIYELVLAIPLLYVASLAYSKLGYYPNVKYWSRFGWILNALGNLFVINAVGLVTAKFDLRLSLVYFFMFCTLMIIYTFINATHNKEIWHRKVLKLIFTLSIIFFGGILLILS
ncbi:MAG: hypothetical protein WCX88_03470 [Patescibacteria group bacterium]